MLPCAGGVETVVCAPMPRGAKAPAAPTVAYFRKSRRGFCIGYVLLVVRPRRNNTASPIDLSVGVVYKDVYLAPVRFTREFHAQEIVHLCCGLVLYVMLAWTGYSC